MNRSKDFFKGYFQIKLGGEVQEFHPKIDRLDTGQFIKRNADLKI